MEEIILATNNNGKVKEIKEILKNKNIISLREAGIQIEVEEDGKTFEENALKKAKEIAILTGKTCIADDSGLCIDILDGFPGVKTDRFLGENATQSDRNTYLLEKLKGVEKSKRKAQVVTCIAKVDSNGNEKMYRGILKGYISLEKRGNKGFGFDEIFEIESGETLAELDMHLKNKISSRKKALEELKKDFE